MSKLASLRQKGFTIIELMIATAVLSTILLLVTVLMINIGNLYYKGINQARIQDNVRSVSDEVSQHLQLGDSFAASDPDKKGANGEQAYCVGAVRYTYIIGVQINQPAPGSPASAPPYHHVLWRDDNPAPGTCDIATAGNKVDLTATAPSSGLNGVELIAPNSRLSEFDINGNSPYSVAVSVAYGDDDLLCNPAAAPSSCATDQKMQHWSDYQVINPGDGQPGDSPPGAQLLCKGSIGQQFCATAKLNTSVIRRLP
jgi:prepilin-type N-terminal cleavage/methylation domain-containing protein